MKKFLFGLALAALASAGNAATQINIANIAGFNAAVNALIAASAPTGVPTSRQVIAGAGLTGGGDLTADRTFALPSVGTAATYGDATHVPAFTTDAYGRVTGVTSTAITFPTPDLSGYVPTTRTVTTAARLTGGGDLSANRTLDLASIVTAGSCGDATHVAAVTYDAYGRTTGCTSTAITFPAPTSSQVTTALGYTPVNPTSLGTASAANTGTSGHVVPYLDTANVFSANVSVVVTGGAATVQIVGDGISQSQVQSYTANASGSNFLVQKARGTQSAPTNLLTGDQPGQFVFQGYGDGGFRTAAKISANVVEPTPSSSAMGSNLIFYTSRLGTIAALPSLTMQPDQSVTFANTLNLPVATISSDAGATYTVASAASYTQYLTAALTANRTATLPTAPFTGQTFRFVRAVASTGAFTWSIGGLKTLNAGTWCDVQYNGSAWIEIAYGSL